MNKISLRKWILNVAVLVAAAASIMMISPHAFAQSTDRAGYQEIMSTGMYVLGSWSLLNIASSVVLRRSGSNRYFDQMNGYWNLVNLGIVGASLSLGAPEPELANKIFALNVGLDVAYIATAAFLRERSKSESKLEAKDRWLGYANSVALQGAFLLIFDIAMWWKIESWQDQQLALVPRADGIAIEFQSSF